MITIADRIREEGREEGRLEGRLEGRGEGVLYTSRQAVLEVLEARFETLSQSIVKALDGIDNPTILRVLLKQAAKADSLEHFRRTMDSILNI